MEEDLGQALIDYEAACVASLPAAERLAMAESEDHLNASVHSRDSLRSFFGRQGRSLSIASNLPVFYPEEEGFAPDLLAVWDVPIRLRDSYQVLREGKGLDLVIEILVRGDRKKDLVTNVTRYARLGIREYFVADLKKRSIHAYRLDATTHRYTPLLGDLGRYRSEVLGLDLMLEQGRLRFYSGTAVVPLLHEEVVRLGEQAQREREQAAAATEEADHLRAQLAESLLTILRLRNLTLSAEQRDQVRACEDSTLLLSWLDRAPTAPSTAAVFDGKAPSIADSPPATPVTPKPTRRRSPKK